MSTFVPEYLDYELSPYTGLTRKSWIMAGRYLLQGIFDNLSDIDQPVVMPRAETETTYPHPDASPGDLEAQKRAEIFEGLTRSLFIASVLIAEDPFLTLNGINVRDYYRLHILRSCTEKQSIEYAGSYEDMKAVTGDTDPYRPFQQTVETCALVIGLNMCSKVLWDTYEKSERDAIADFLTGFAHANTAPQNWRLFNMLDMAFLHMNGYEIDTDIMADHALSIANFYAGDGWYRDGHSFDYYSCWAFNFYAPLWNRWYGYEHMPEIAARYEEYSNRLMVSFPGMFDEDGYVNMWGRSCIYRNAVTSAFDGNFFLKEPKADPGLARRISSGALLQFITRDDFLVNGIPSLGFYGQFTPLVQRYSCAESPFWIGKAFLCLHLDESHPFWSAKEHNGVWEELKEDEVGQTVLDGPALVLTAHKGNGSTILRSGKVVKEKGDRHGMWNYSKLCYHTKYPWESSVSEDTESQQYVLKSGIDGHTERANITFYAGVKDGVMYRRQLFDHEPSTEWHWLEAADLADYPVSLGIIRADRIRICKRPVTFTLGSYGFPDDGHSDIRLAEGDAVSVSDGEGWEEYLIPRAVIIDGHDHTGRAKHMAMTIYTGFDKLSYVRSSGTNPDSEHSFVAYAAGSFRRQYDAADDSICISQVITAEGDRELEEDEIFPVSEIVFMNAIRRSDGSTVPGSSQRVIIKHKNGMVRTVDYTGMEGRLAL